MLGKEDHVTGREGSHLAGGEAAEAPVRVLKTWLFGDVRGWSYPLWGEGVP